MPTVALSDDQVPVADPAPSPSNKQPVMALSDDQVPIPGSNSQPGLFQRFVGAPISQAVSGFAGIPGAMIQAAQSYNDSLPAPKGIFSGKPLQKVSTGYSASDDAMLNRITPSAIQDDIAKSGWTPDSSFQPKGLERFYDNVTSAALPMLIPGGQAEGVANMAKSGIFSGMANYAKSRVPGIMSAASAGTWQAVAQELAPDNGWAQLIGGLVGGHAPVMAGNALLKAAGIKESFSPNAKAAKALQTAVTNSGENPADVAARLDDAPSLAGGPGETPYQPTTATVSNNPGLISLEKGAAQKDPKMAATIQNNRLATAQGLTAATASQGAAPEVAQKFFQDDANQQQSLANSKITSLQALKDQADNAPLPDVSIPQAIKQNLPSGVRADASAQSIPALSEEQKALAAKRDALYSQIPDNTPVSSQHGLNAAHEVLSSAAPIDGSGVHPLVSNFIKKYAPNGVPEVSMGSEPITDPVLAQKLRDAAGPQGESQPQPMTLGEARRNQSAIGDAIGSTTNQSHRYQLTKLKQAIGNAIDESSGGQESVAANKFNKEEYSPRFGEGPGGVDTVRQAVQGKIQPSQAISKSLSTDEGAQQLAKAGGNRPEVQSAVRSHFLGKLGESLGDKPTASDIQDFLNKNDSTLQHFPNVKTDIQKYRNMLSSKSSMTGPIEAEIEKAQQNAKGVSDSINNGPTSAFLGKYDSPKSAMASIYNSKNPKAMMSDLLAQAAKDKTGQTIEGLKNATRQLISEAHTSGYVGKGNKLDFEKADFAASQHKLGQWLTDGSDKNQALRSLFTNEELQPLQMVHRQILNESRRSQPVLSGSQTASNLAAADEHEKSLAQELVSHAAEGAAHHATGGVSSALKIGKNTLSWLGSKITGDQAKKILNDALLDPGLAKTLLKRPTSANIPKIKMQLAPYITGVASSLITNKDDKPAVNKAPETAPISSPVETPKQPIPRDPLPASQTAPTAQNKLPDNPEVRRAELAPFEEQSPDVQKQLLAQQQTSKPTALASGGVDPSVMQHIREEEGPTTVQDGRREYYGFKAGEDEGFSPIQKAVKQYGLKDPKTLAVVDNLLSQKAQEAGADKFSNPGAQAAVATIAHMRGVEGSHAIMASVAGYPLKKSMSAIPDDVVAKVNAMDPQELQQKLRESRLAYDRQFLGKGASSITQNGQTSKGSWWSLYGKGLTNRYNREAQQFAAMGQPSELVSAR